MLKPTWCPGCGNYGIYQALQNTFSGLSLTPTNVVIVYGIGCHGNMFNWLPFTSIEGLHGRALPIAQGIKMARQDLTVFAIAGDGDCYGEGGNHFLHAARRNMDITLLVHDNQVYALTTGQTSPSSDRGFKTKSTPTGSETQALNPIAIAIAAGASFVARAFADDTPYLTSLVSQAVKHKGFSFVDILQPCVSFNQVNTRDWYKERIYKLEDEGYRAEDKFLAFKKALEWPDSEKDNKIPIGIFFQEEREVFEGKVLEEKTEFNNLLKEFI